MATGWVTKLWTDRFEHLTVWQRARLIFSKPALKPGIRRLHWVIGMPFQFIAPKGRLLYQSSSDKDPTFTRARTVDANR